MFHITVNYLVALSFLNNKTKELAVSLDSKDDTCVEKTANSFVLLFMEHKAKRLIVAHCVPFTAHLISGMSLMSKSGTTNRTCIGTNKISLITLFFLNNRTKELAGLLDSKNDKWVDKIAMLTLCPIIHATYSDKTN